MEKYSDWDAEIYRSGLIELAEKLGIEVRREVLGDEEAVVKSGLAYVDGKPILFLDKRISSRETVAVLIRELKGFPMEDVYIRPALRRLLLPEQED